MGRPLPPAPLPAINTCPPLPLDQFVNEPRLYLSASASEHTTAESGIANRQARGRAGLGWAGGPPGCAAAAAVTQDAMVCVAAHAPLAASQPAKPTKPAATHPPNPVCLPASHAKQIDAAVGQYVLPLMPALFADEDPMPL